MLTIKSITKGVASISLDVDGITYPWTVGALAEVQDAPAHLEANADIYRQDIRNAKAMGRVLEPVVLPTLEEAKTQALEELKTGVTGVKFDLWPQDKLIDLSRPTGPATGYTVEDRDRAYQQIDDLNAIRFQIAQEVQAAPDLETLQQIVDDYRSLYA